MQLDFKIKMNEKLYLRDPEGTEIGKEILRHTVKMMAEIGYGQFTFKKLAVAINSTEATVYRYFENKHKLLIYLVDWYWAFTEFQLLFKTEHLVGHRDKINMAIDILVLQEDTASVFSHLRPACTVRNSHCRRK